MSVPDRPLSDLDLSRAVDLRPMSEIADAAGIAERHLQPYGRTVAKVSPAVLDEIADRPPGRYVVVTAVTPTPLGEGKTTTTVGLGQAFRHIGRRGVIAVRQPSAGPTFGIKGGAAGGGMSQIVPMETVNLHLTGDLHAVTAAHNLLAAMLDNHLHKGNRLEIDPHSISWRRVLDSCDRDLRRIVTGLGPRADGTPRETGFDITAASEVMAVLALSTSLADLRERLARIVVAYDVEGSPVTAGALRAAGAMCVLLRDALAPNLMQTSEHTPAFVHCGPFGNIAHGNSSVLADLVGIRCGDYLVTEAGFGADMGAERFFNIKCRASGLVPDAAVVVATVRALKVHSGRHRVVAGRPLPDGLLSENPDDVLAGADNLRHQIAAVRAHGVTPVVAVNAFPADFASEHRAVLEIAAAEGVSAVVTHHVAKGGIGAADLASAVEDACAEPAGAFRLLYPDGLPLVEKIETVARRVYGADGVDLSVTARRQLEDAQRQGFGGLPVCVAKTHLSVTADPSRPGAPTGWRLPVREVRVSAGAGFVTPLCGDISTMPGLSSAPAAERIDVLPDGRIVGLS